MIAIPSLVPIAEDLLALEVEELAPLPAHSKAGGCLGLRSNHENRARSMTHHALGNAA